MIKMIRMKLNNIIKDMECQISVNEIIDTSVKFEAINVVENERKDSGSNNAEKGICDVVAKGNIKRIIKYKILKPVFNIMYRINPSAAINIRAFVYNVVHRLKYRNKFECSTTLKKQKNKINVLFDCTATSKTEFVTGIQRVVNNIIINLDNDVVTGTTYGEVYQTNSAYKNKLMRINSNNDEYAIDFKRTKKWVLADLLWDKSELFNKYLDEFNGYNHLSYSVIYDLLPIKYAEYFDSQYFVDAFTKWHNMILAKTDHIICISKAVSDDVIKYYEESKIKRDKPLKISYFPLGADLPTVTVIKDKFIRNKIKNFVSDKTFLMVGTIEPRKGHLIALEAFTKRLDAGDGIKLLIIGRNGWKNEEFLNLLNNNKYYGKNILWLADVNDIELAWCYQHACCLIAASKDEGYGLPLVEAAHYGVPIICSDIPVFREVAQGYADYFKVWDSGALADTIKDWLKTEEHPDSKNIRIYSWAEATKIFMEIINGEREPYKIIK